MTRGRSPVRVWAGVGAAFFVSLSAAIFFLDVDAGSLRQNPDPWAVGRQVQRFEPLRRDLAQPSVLGYYTDVPVEDRRSTSLFFATAYSLAPHLVTDRAESNGPDLVVGHFQRRPDLTKLESENGLKLVKDYGKGVLLFRRVKR